MSVSVPLQPLSQRISTIPKLDKEQFVSSFLREQKTHAKAYRQEGRDLAASWNRQVLPPTHVPCEAELKKEYGFETPILKPRVPRRNFESHSPRLPTQDDCVEHDALRGESPKMPRKKGKRSLTPPAPVQKTKRKTRSRLQTSDDGGHAIRLRDRRERKRVKRAILQPADDIDAAEDKEKKKSSKNQAPASLALMYGFSATNVGSGRLTVKPSLSIGVFSKGKASVKTRITERKSSKAKALMKETTGFSEAAFLNTKNGCSSRGQLKIRSQASDSSDKSTLSTTSSVSRSRTQDTGIPMDNKQCKGKASNPKQKSGDENDNGLVKSTASSSKTILQDGSIVESTIWDIERDDFLLPDQIASRDSAMGSVLLDTCQVIWSAGILGETDVPQNHPPSMSPGILHSRIISDSHSVSSISPSQSASQYPIPEPTAEASRYFVVPAIHRQPVEDPAHLRQDPTLSLQKVDSATSLIVFSGAEVRHPPLGSPTSFRPDPLESQVCIPYSESLLLSNLESNDILLPNVPDMDPHGYQYCDLKAFSPCLPEEITYEEYTDYEAYIGSEFLDQSQRSLDWDENPEVLFGTSERYEIRCELDGCPDLSYFSGEDENGIPHQGVYDHSFSCHVEDPEGGEATFYLSDSNGEQQTSIDDFGQAESVLSSCADASSDIVENADEHLGRGDCLFSQGRALLFGYAERSCEHNPPMSFREGRISVVENDVAKGMKNHWRPLRLG